MLFLNHQHLKTAKQQFHLKQSRSKKLSPGTYERCVVPLCGLAEKCAKSATARSRAWLYFNGWLSTKSQSKAYKETIFLKS